MNIFHHCIITVLFLAVVGDIGSVLNTLWSSGFELASSSSGFLLPVAESAQSGVLNKIQQNKGKKNNTILKHKLQGKNGTNRIRWGKKNKGDKKHWTVDDKKKVFKPKWWKKEHKWWNKEHMLKDTARQVRMESGGLVRRVETDDGAVEAGTGPTARRVGGGAGGRAGENTGNWMAKRRSIENGQ